MRNTTFIASIARTRIAVVLLALGVLVSASGCDILEQMVGGTECGMVGEAVAEAIARPDQFDEFAKHNLAGLADDVAACVSNPLVPVQIAAAAVKSCKGGEVCEALDSSGVKLILEGISAAAKGDVSFLATAGGALTAAGIDLPLGDLDSLVDEMTSAFMGVFDDLAEALGL